MNIIERYSDKKFLSIVGKKPGNLKYFRKLLRDNNKIAARERLSDKHVEIFKNAVALREKTYCSWDTAFRTVLNISEEEKTENVNPNDYKKLQQEVNELKAFIKEQEVRIRSLEMIWKLRD